MRCLPLLLTAIVSSACIQDTSRQHPGGDEPPDAAPATPTPDGPAIPIAGSTLALTIDDLSFAIVGDTRPPMSDDTTSYPTAIITSIWASVAAAAPAFAVSTGDYVYVSSSGVQTNPQLDIYLGARAAYAGPVFPALGNHECATATASNCGRGALDGTPLSYQTYLRRMVEPLGVFRENERARRTYARLGFVEEGTLREEYFHQDGWHDMVRMSLLDREWRPDGVR
jgi:hypothetical protein